MFNAILDSYSPDARNNMSPTCDYQNWLQIWPNVFLGSKIKTWMRSTIFKTFLLLVSLSLLAIDVLPRETRCQLSNTRCTEQAGTCLCSHLYALLELRLKSILSWRALAHSSGSSRSIYRYHNKKSVHVQVAFPPTETIIYTVTFWSHFLLKLERKSSPCTYPHLIHHLDLYLNNMNLKQVSPSNVQPWIHVLFIH